MAAIALFATQALAADSGPLAPGRPAGTAKAQDADTNNILYLLDAGAIIAGIALLASDHHKATTTGTSGGGTTTTTTT